MKQEITIHVRLDPKGFRAFCRFDTFRRQRRWYAPVLAGLLFITLSTLVMFLKPELTGSVAGLLMGLGLAVPMVCFGLYLIQIAVQISRLGLKDSPTIYTLRFRGDAICVTAGRPTVSTVTLQWEQMWAAFQRNGYIYLYANPQRAFILPDGQANASPDELWDLIVRHMGDGKCRSLLRRQ